MARGKELKILPSAAGCRDAEERELEQLSEKEKEEWKERICRKISRNISAYYTVHQDEWEEFVKAVSRNQEGI